MNFAIQFIRRVYAFMLAVVAMLSTAIPIAPSPHDYDNEYAVRAVVSEETEDKTIFTDETDRRWFVETKGEDYSYDTQYVLIVYNNLTQDTSDDYVLTVMRYLPPEGV